MNVFFVALTSPPGHPSVQYKNLSEISSIYLRIACRTCRVCLQPQEVLVNDVRARSYNDEDSLSYNPVFFNEIKKYGDAEMHKWIKVKPARIIQHIFISFYLVLNHIIKYNFFFFLPHVILPPSDSMFLASSPPARTSCGFDIDPR